MRTTRFKFIRYTELGSAFNELYDLEFDPFELENQVANAEYSEDVRSLVSLLDHLLVSIPDNSRR